MDISTFCWTPSTGKLSREKGSFMPALKSSGDERRDLLAYLSRLDGISVGPLPTEVAAIPADAISRF